MYFVLLFRDHAERAIEIINSILPEDHLLLASSKRVKGKTLNVFYFLMKGVNFNELNVLLGSVYSYRPHHRFCERHL